MLYKHSLLALPQGNYFTESIFRNLLAQISRVVAFGIDLCASFSIILHALALCMIK